jgi:uncharacterized membrane protein
MIFMTIDSWLGLPIPGVGFLLALLLITLVGFMASSIVTRSLLGALDRIFDRLPFVRLLYSSAKDMLNAFVGEKRRFDIPVTVTIAPGSGVKMIGFVTRESLDIFGMADYVAVYVPQAYAFAGHLLLVPASQVERMSGESADLMAFVVSGGVADGARRESRAIKTG